MEEPMAKNEAFNRGVKDCSKGKAVSDNPYAQDLNAAASWLDGFSAEVERQCLNNNRKRLGLRELPPLVSIPS